jgi:hypothetical protein
MVVMSEATVTLVTMNFMVLKRKKERGGVGSSWEN